MIVGRSTVTVDAQGRVIVPSAWQADLGESVVVIRDRSAYNEDFLTALPAKAYQAMIDDFSMNPPSDKRYADVSRHILQYANWCKLDQKRRITVDAENLRYAGITTTAVLTANIKSNNPVFEIWDPEALERNNKAFSPEDMEAGLSRHAEEVRNSR